LYRALSPRLIAFCRRKGCDASLAEELAQQAWVRLIQRRPETRSFISLLLKTAQNLNLMALRKGATDARCRSTEPAGRLAGGVDPAVVAAHRDERQTVRACLSDLGDEDRAFLILCDVEGLSRREACRRVGWDISTSTAHQRHTRIRAELAAALEKNSVSWRKNGSLRHRTCGIRNLNARIKTREGIE
jgi:RNA polymerase sigma factor (sigma-70 family)